MEDKEKLKIEDEKWKQKFSEGNEKELLYNKEKELTLKLKTAKKSSSLMFQAMRQNFHNVGKRKFVEGRFR